MGISVPIGPEHYKNLKEISERLGTGLKKTVEYLVSYYWEREMTISGEKIHSLPAKEIDKEQRYKELVASAFSSITSIKPVSTVPPSVVSVSSTSKNQSAASAPPKTTPLSMNIGVYCSSCNAPRKPTAKFCYNCGKLL